jgi:hypothetical protein
MRKIPHGKQGVRMTGEKIDSKDKTSTSTRYGCHVALGIYEALCDN